jgi:uncharacterized protein DUF2510
VTAVTTNTPPGWYAEPGHTGNGPAMERWWDGNAWTEYTRTAPVQDIVQGGSYPAQGPYAYPYPSGAVATPPGGGGRRTGTVVIAIMAALVLIGAVVAGVLVLGKDNGNGDKSADATPTPSGAPPHRGQRTPPSTGGQGDQGGSGGTPSTAPSPGSPVVDAYDGISLPVLDGWQGTAGTNGIGANVVTGGYPCPTDSSQDCVRGGVFAEPAAALKISGSDPEAAAKADIAPNATNAYGASTYGPTTGHQQVASQSVTVAGQKGYMVRWKVTTKSGTNGYVESLVFPSPFNKAKLVVVRFGFDIGGKAPGPDVMDRITQGIKADDSGGTTSSGGTGV